MNKSQAKKKVLTGEVTFGELRGLLENHPYEESELSKVNKNLPKSYAIKIMLSAVTGREDSQKVEPLTLNRTLTREIMTRDATNAVNVLIECG